MVVHLGHTGPRGFPPGSPSMFGIHVVLRASAVRGQHVGLHQLAPLLDRTPRHTAWPDTRVITLNNIYFTILNEAIIYYN